MADPGDTLKALMDGLVTLEGTMNAALPAGFTPLTGYRWRPRGLPDLPAYWHWPSATGSPLEQRDQAQFRDVFQISAFIGVEFSDSDEQMAALETYADAARAVLDQGFHQNDPLDGACVFAKRTGLRPTLDTFNRTDVLCMELPLELWIHRILTPGS